MKTEDTGAVVLDRKNTCCIDYAYPLPSAAELCHVHSIMFTRFGA